jgi:hypothetical protein
MKFGEAKSNIEDDRIIRVGLTGASTSDPTKRAGPGVTVTRTAIGVYKFSFYSEDPGTFVQIAGYMFGAVTPSGVKGYTATRGAYTAPSGSTPASLSVSLWDASFAAVDLTSVQYLDISFSFAQSSVIT